MRIVVMGVVLAIALLMTLAEPRKGETYPTTTFPQTTLEPTTTTLESTTSKESVDRLLTGGWQSE